MWRDLNLSLKSSQKRRYDGVNLAFRRRGTVPVDISHIGEDLIAEMLRSIAQRKQLDRIICAATNRTFAQDVEEFDLGEQLTFSAEDASLIVDTGSQKYSCDGEQKVDVLCLGKGSAIAFESKLGNTRMAAPEFRKRFCTMCAISKHSGSRLSGSMIAVLERSMPFEGECRLFAKTNETSLLLRKPWWLVVRQSVFQTWNIRSDIPVKSVRILLFDQLAQLFGSRQQFDGTVTRLIGSDFSRRWSPQLPDSR